VARQPYLADIDPHDGVARAHAMTVQGIDVSNWQGDIDWNKVRAAGTQFAFIKATEGGDYLDPKFAQNWQAAKSVGIPRGAYHMVYWCRRRARAGAVVHPQRAERSRCAAAVLDLEWNGHSRACPKRIPVKLALEKVKIMLEVMEAHTGKRPIIYTDVTFHREVLEGELPGYNFWLRSVAAEPQENLPRPALAVLAVHHHGLRARHREASRSQRVQRHLGDWRQVLPARRPPSSRCATRIESILPRACLWPPRAGKWHRCCRRAADATPTAAVRRSEASANPPRGLPLAPELGLKLADGGFTGGSAGGTEYSPPHKTHARTIGHGIRRRRLDPRAQRQRPRLRQIDRPDCRHRVATASRISGRARLELCHRA
jgi:lysozyme